MKDRIIDVIKGAVEVNLRYTSIVLNLSKEYLKDFDHLLREDGAQAPAQDVPAATGAGQGRRWPILLVGQLNEVAGGAFVLNNTAESDLNVHLVVQGELDPQQVRLAPASLVIAPGSSAVIRLSVTVTDALQPGRDYFGAVLVPGLSTQAIEFIVRRLEGDAGRAPAPDEAAASSAATPE